MNVRGRMKKFYICASEFNAKNVEKCRFKLYKNKK